uniref:Uncharacterized protein n=1 Tax=Janibacter limosus TaxID=53458 RepID=A0AC61U6Q4_9MICO|nr:hypothetical protein [Janibacter limosus]
MNTVGPAPGSQSSLRRANRERVVETLSTNGPLTRVEIAGATGLSPATISNLVRDLDGDGAVSLTNSVRNGRRAVLVSLLGGAPLLAGVAFGDRDIRIAVGTGPNDLIARHRMPLPQDHNADEGLDRAARLLHEVLADNGHTLADPGAGGARPPGSCGLGQRCRGVRADHARVAGSPRRGRAAGGVGDPGHPGQHRQLRGRGRAARRRTGRGGDRRLPQALPRCGRRAGHRRHGLPGERRYRGGDRPPDHRRGRAGVSLRQPRLPQHLRRVTGAHLGDRALPGPDPLARDRLPGPAGRPRVPAGHHRRRPSPRGRARRSGQPAQPGGHRRGGQLAGTGDLLLDAMREGVERGAIPSAAASVTLVPGALGDDAEVRGALLRAAGAGSARVG